MRNIKNIDSFLPEPKFMGSTIEELSPNVINEAISDGDNLAGKSLSDVKVSDWMFDFGIERSSFPKNSAFNDFVDPDEDLSVFTGQVVNRFVVEAWKAIKTKKIFKSAISEDERKKIKSKLKGFWSSKNKLENYNREKETLKEFLDALEAFIIDGGFGASIQMNSESILLTKSSASPSAGAINKIVTSLKTFFTKPGWQKALSWIINSIANNDQYVKWMDTTVYEGKVLGSGISPDVKSAFNTFIVECDLNVNVPDMEYAMGSINKTAKLVIDKSKDLPKQGAETWMGCMYNTYLFGVYQRLLIIGCCAWVYDLVGDTDMMSSDAISTPYVKPDSDASSSYGSSSLEVEEFKGVSVYKISYLSSDFRDILKGLLRDEQIGKSRYEEYINRIEAKKDSRSIIRSVRSDILGWGNRHGFRRSDTPVVKALYTDGSTRLIIPVEMFKKVSY